MSRQLPIARSVVAAWLGPVVALSLLSAPVSAWSKPAKAAEAAEGEAASAQTPSDEDRQQAQQGRTEAQRRFAQQDYEGAIEAFEGAHALAPDPTDLFNIGRVYEEQGDLVQALTYYERFSREPRLELEERQAAAERIEVLRVLVEAQSDPPVPESAPRQSPTRGSDPPAERSADPPTDDRSRRAVSPLVTGGSVLLGAGAAMAIAGGVGFGVSAQRVGETVGSLDQGHNPDRLSLAQAEDQHARGQNLEALQITFIATGAAVAAVGAGLLTAGLLEQRRARLQALAPALSPSMVALHATWRF